MADVFKWFSWWTTLHTIFRYPDFVDGTIHLISGPNNSGKSVYLKQVGKDWQQLSALHVGLNHEIKLWSRFRCGSLLHLLFQDWSLILPTRGLSFLQRQLLSELLTEFLLASKRGSMSAMHILHKPFWERDGVDTTQKRADKLDWTEQNALTTIVVFYWCNDRFAIVNSFVASSVTSTASTFAGDSCSLSYMLRHCTNRYHIATLKCWAWSNHTNLPFSYAQKFALSRRVWSGHFHSGSSSLKHLQ